MAHKHPCNGGCWFCHEDDEHAPLLFEWEFDTYVHVECLRKALETDPNHPEARLMKYLLENPEQAGVDTNWIKQQLDKKEGK